MPTLEKFLIKHAAGAEGLEFAKNLTLEQFLNTCGRGDWILWLFAETNPKSKREITLAKGYCANTVRHLMKDPRSIAAVDAAIAYGEGKINEKDLAAADVAAYAAACAAATAAAYATACAACAVTATAAAVAAAAAAAAAYAVTATDAPAFAAARKVNRKQTADICRKHLPLEIWNQEEIV